MRRRTAAWVAACLVLTACGIGMPDSGAVHETTATGSNPVEQPGNIDPPRPKKGATAEEIVSGFLDAMTATPPIRTSVAREFLTQEASATWQPTGMVVYAAPQTPRGTQEVEVKLLGANRMDASGAWLGPVPDEDATVKFPMDVEDGEWRISQPPPYLLVPQSWFAQRFRQASLYFVDPSATVLIPEPVFVPRGRQLASTLVNGLLQGPSPDLTEESYLPPGLRSISVPVSSSGVAQVDLTSDSGDTSMPPSDQSDLLISQLAWTLRQDPTISRFRVSIDERPVQLAGESEFDVDHGHEYAPYVAGSSTLLYGLQDGLMVGGSPQNLEPVTGPFGRPGYSLRTVSPDLRAEEVAAVSTSGSTLWVAPVKDSGTNPTLIDAGEDLLRPAWDFSGRLWEVDRRSTGAVVSYRRKGKMHVLDVPGVSGENVKHFLVSRDGSRLVAVVRKQPGTDTIVVSRILTSADGHVMAALPAHDITEPETQDSQIRDIAWYSPTSLVVLLPVNGSLFSVRSASVDGATPADALSVPIEKDVVGLAGTPDPDEPSYGFAPAGPDNLAAILTDLAGPTGNGFEIDPGVTMLSYVG